MLNDGDHSVGPDDTYIAHGAYAVDRINSIRAFRLIQTHLVELFRYIEPTDANAACYSHELYSLLLRTCTEFESNSRLVLLANGYQCDTHRLNVVDYKKLNTAMRLDEYWITLHDWDGAKRRFRPFESWGADGPLPWYQAYNRTKHSRFNCFRDANLLHLVHAIGGVGALLFAQFYESAFGSRGLVFVDSSNENLRLVDGSPIGIEPPTTWTSNEEYEFDWNSLKGTSNPFQPYPF